jgi:MFS family permease
VQRLLSHLGPPLRAVRAVIRNRAITRAQLAFLLFNIAEPSMWIAILVYAYDQGGTGAVGLVSILLLVPAGLLAPVAAALGDRFRRERMLRWGYLAQGVGCLGLGLTVALDAPAWLVYAIGVVASLTFVTGRPGHHALLPTLADGPEEVAASNSVSSLTEGIGGALGAVLAAAVQAAAGTSAVFIASGTLGVIAAAVMLGLHTTAQAAQGRFRLRSLATDAVEGMSALIRSRDPRLLVGIVAALAVATGVVGVLTVPLAIDALGLGDPGVGLISTTWSVGAFLGAGVSVGFVARRSLAGPLIGFAGGFAIAAVLFGVADAVVVAVAGAVIVGASITLLDVVGRTLLQRATDDRMLTRVLGVVEALWLLGYAGGSAAAPLLERWVGLFGGFLIGGGLMVVSGLVAFPGLRRIDRTAQVPERELALLARIPMFAPLPRLDLERLAWHLDRFEVAAGTEVIRQGDVGDRFYVVDAGTFEVARDGEVIATAGEGDYFGEIALLHDVPRTASVRATEPSAVWALDQEEFLATVTGLPQAESAAHAVSAERMRTATGSSAEG